MQTFVPETSRSSYDRHSEPPQVEIKTRIDAARLAQARWSRTSLQARLQVIRKVRHEIADQAQELVASVTCPSRNGPAETLAAEIIPLADACHFLEKESRTILAAQRLSRRGRPGWLRGVSVTLRREPLGVVLIVGASNYPLFLSGVQTLQALVAGNAVLMKPGSGSTQATQRLVEIFAAVGLDDTLVQVLPEDPQWVELAVEAGIDKVVLTGSAETGRRVQSLLAKSLTPSTMELSGCDAVFVLDHSNLKRVVEGLAFGLRFNNSATCIAPRRVFVSHAMKVDLEDRLRKQLLRCKATSNAPISGRAAELVAAAIRDGARVLAGGFVSSNDRPMLGGPTVLTDAAPHMQLLRSDVFAPVLSLVPVGSTSEALAANRECPYALGAAVFGRAPEACDVAEQIDAGCVVVNDIIAPTADPRVPFGGRKQSGFGVTRGAAGLIEMTQLKSIVQQRGRWLPHLEPSTPLDARLLRGLLVMSHGRNWRLRLRGLWDVVRTGREQRRWNKEHQQGRQGNGE